MAQSDEGICAKVKVRLSQDVVLARTTFSAALGISNTGAEKITNVRTSIYISHDNVIDDSDLFVINDPEINGIDSISGEGTLSAGGNAGINWKIIPTRNAAVSSDTVYFVGGSLSYKLNGEQTFIELSPARITVKPDPLLYLHYFLQRNVYSDDPFTSEVEAPEPAGLGLLVLNKGYGTARKMQIGTSQPQIVENEKGLLVGFKLIGAQVNANPISPALNVDFGDINPLSTATTLWQLTSSVQGHFKSFDATLQHIDALNNAQTSLIDSVTTHFLEHAVRIVKPTDDNRPDFLTDDVEDTEKLPDTVWGSTGEPAPVTAITTATVTANATAAGVNARVILPTTPAGYVYIRANDPTAGRLKLAHAYRADGGEVLIESNAWTTHRIVRLEGQAPTREDRIHLFDSDPSAYYDLVYTRFEDTAPGRLGNLKGMADGGHVRFGKSPSDGTSGGGAGGNTGGNGSVSGPLVVTAVFADCLYVEALDRSSGIRMTNAIMPEGTVIYGEGTLHTADNGERYIEATTVTAAGTASIGPLGVTTRGLHGGDFFYESSTGGGQKGMFGGLGLNTVGLLISTFGKVIAVTTSDFLMEDGDGRPFKVTLPVDVPAPSVGAFVAVTGAVSVDKRADGLHPLVLPRRIDDLKTDVDTTLRQSFPSPTNLLVQGVNWFSIPGIPANPVPPVVLSPFASGTGLNNRLSRFDMVAQLPFFWDSARENNPTLFGNFLLGEGFEITLGEGAATTFAFDGYRSAEKTDRWISLPRLGRTQIGNPFLLPVSWEKVLVTDGIQTRTLADAARSLAPPWLNSVAQYQDRVTGQAKRLGLPDDAPDSQFLEAWLGYRVSSSKDNIALILPFPEAVPITLTKMTPLTVPAGSGNFTLVVEGTGFLNGATVRWNSADRPTAYISATRLEATISAADVVAAGASSIAVANPVPVPGVSNSLAFAVSAPTGTVVLTTVAATASRENGVLSVVLTLRNDGTAPARNIQLLTGVLGSTGTTTNPLPSMASLEPNQSLQIPLTFPGTAASTGANVFLKCSGTFTGGTFTTNRRVTIP